jgi:hypothetical protein
MTVMRTLLAGAVLAACCAGPVYAQGRTSKGPDATPMQLEDAAKQRDRDSIDKQYRSTLEKTRGATTAARPDDPWANMRSTDDVKPKR